MKGRKRQVDTTVKKITLTQTGWRPNPGGPEGGNEKREKNLRPPYERRQRRGGVLIARFRCVHQRRVFSIVGGGFGASLFSVAAGRARIGATGRSNSPRISTARFTDVLYCSLRSAQFLARS